MNERAQPIFLTCSRDPLQTLVIDLHRVDIASSSSSGLSLPPPLLLLLRLHRVRILVVILQHARVLSHAVAASVGDVGDDLAHQRSLGLLGGLLDEDWSVTALEESGRGGLVLCPGCCGQPAVVLVVVEGVHLVAEGGVSVLEGKLCYFS